MARDRVQRILFGSPELSRPYTEPSRRGRFLAIRRQFFGRWPGRPSTLERYIIGRAMAQEDAEKPTREAWVRMMVGSCQGGRAPVERRCTKRLRTRRCRNWAVPGLDRCHRHPRPSTAPATAGSP